MKIVKPFVVLAVVGGAIAISTGIGQTLLTRIDQHLGQRSLESRIKENREKLRDNRVKIEEQIFRLNTKVGQEEAKQRRLQEERDRLDNACHRIAPKINKAKENGGEIEWGMHTLTCDDAIELLGEWARRVEELGKELVASEQKMVACRKAAEQLGQDSKRFSDSIAKLDAKLQELLAQREVLTVQRDVAEILAAADGRAIHGETGGLLAELRDENDGLRGEISAYGHSPTSRAFVDPDDDLENHSGQELLQRYGVKGSTSTEKSKEL